MLRTHAPCLKAGGCLTRKQKVSPPHDLPRWISSAVSHLDSSELHGWKHFAHHSGTRSNLAERALKRDTASASARWIGSEVDGFFFFFGFLFLYGLFVF